MKLKHFFLFLFQLILRSHFHLFHVSGQLDVGIVESIVDDIPEQMTDHGGVSHVEVLHHLRYCQLIRQHVDLASELSVDCGIGISLNHSRKIVNFPGSKFFVWAVLSSVAILSF